MEATTWICVVDDNVDYHTLIHLFFKKAYPNHTVHTFADGMAFLKVLPQLGHLPSLILLDRHMPNLDGHKTLAFLKQHPRYRRIPVVMMSADASRKEIDSCYDSGVNSFLLKSTNPAWLQEALTTVCRYWLELNQMPTAA